MTTQQTGDGATNGDTMNVMSPAMDASRMAAAARAQLDLVQLLARLVLTSVETAAAATPPSQPHAAHERRARNLRT